MNAVLRQRYEINAKDIFEILLHTVPYYTIAFSVDRSQNSKLKKDFIPYILLIIEKKSLEIHGLLMISQNSKSTMQNRIKSTWSD